MMCALVASVTVSMEGVLIAQARSRTTLLRYTPWRAVASAGAAFGSARHGWHRTAASSFVAAISAVSAAAWVFLVIRSIPCPRRGWIDFSFLCVAPPFTSATPAVAVLSGAQWPHATRAAQVGVENRSVRSRIRGKDCKMLRRWHKRSEKPAEPWRWRPPPTAPSAAPPTSSPPHPARPRSSPRAPSPAPGTFPASPVPACRRFAIIGEGACDDGRGLEDTPVRLKLYMVTIGLSILARRRVRMTSVRAAAAGL